MSQIPGAARKVRAVLDWTVSLPFRRDVSEVGSIGHPDPLRDEVYELGGSTGRSALSDGARARRSTASVALHAPFLVVGQAAPELVVARRQVEGSS